jgi:hypothetical protein
LRPVAGVARREVERRERERREIERREIERREIERREDGGGRREEGRDRNDRSPVNPQHRSADRQRPGLTRKEVRKKEGRYGWIPHNVSFGFLDIAGPTLGVFCLWTGFELPSSCLVLPCYASNLNRNILDFMK